MRKMLALFTVFAVVFTVATAERRSADATVPGAIGKMAFWSDRDQANGEIYARDAGGGLWQRLTWNTEREFSLDWSSDGTKIAYTMGPSSQPAIWVMNANGGAKHPVAMDGFGNSDPSWSPDGTRIVYVSKRSTNAYSIWVMNANGSGKTGLTTAAAGTYDTNPEWSPDGNRIAFTSDRDGDNDVYVMGTDGGNVVNLTDESASMDSNPTWSPDGAQIAFLSNRAGLTSDLYVMNADGSDVRRLTTILSSKVAPAWSPDGAHIAFTSLVNNVGDLWMVDPDGSNLTQLTNDPANEWFTAWESVNRPPIASNDGPYHMSNGRTLHGSSVLSNDSDPDGEALVANLESGPSHAANFSFAANGTFTYEHDGSPPMMDSFTYRAVDTRSGISNAAQTTIFIGLTDSVGLVDPATGMWHLITVGAGVSDFYYGNPGDYPFMGDWDCNGVDTAGLYRQSDGYVYLRNSNTQGNANLTFFFGNPGDVPLAGDFNGDGCDTVSIYRPSEARFYIINALGQDGGGLGAADYSFLFGDAGDKPVVGDWDGDAMDEIGLHRESSGFFYYRNTLATGIADGQFYFGDPGDRFVAGDWGMVDGADTPGLFRPSNLTFYLRYTLTQGNADEEFTWPGAVSSWLPVAGNFGAP